MQLEEAGLEQIHAELRALQHNHDALDAEVKAAQKQVHDPRSAGHFEITVLEAYLARVEVQKNKLKQQKDDARRRLVEKMAAVSKRKLDVKLLEKLRVRGQENWKAEADREVANLAEESFLARWNRNRR